MTPPPGRPRPPIRHAPEPRHAGPDAFPHSGYASEGAPWPFSRTGPSSLPGGEGEARPPRAPPPSDRARRRMLDVSREGHFRYDLRELLVQSSFPPEKIGAFHASIVSKGARIGTQAAKEFVTGKLDEQLLTRPERDAIVALLDRYSRWR